MKKILALFIATASYLSLTAQDKTMSNSTKATLDGKVFKISLTAKENTISNTIVTGTSTSQPGIGTEEKKVETIDNSRNLATAKSDESLSNATATDAGQEKPAQADAVNPDVNNVAADVHSDAGYPMYEKSLNGNKATISFNNGMIESSLLTERQFTSCPYNINTSGGNLIAFTAVCKSPDPVATARWSGTVAGNTIKGNLSWIVANGQVVAYSFTGTVVTTEKKSAVRNPSSSNLK